MVASPALDEQSNADRRHRSHGALGGLVALVVCMTLASPARAEIIIGTSDPDQLHGTVEVDYIWGFRGDDRLRGSGEADFLVAGRGDDRIWGGPGKDLIYGGLGTDYCYITRGDLYRGCEAVVLPPVHEGATR